MDAYEEIYGVTPQVDTALTQCGTDGSSNGGATTATVTTGGSASGNNLLIHGGQEYNKFV